MKPLVLFAAGALKTSGMIHAIIEPYTLDSRYRARHNGHDFLSEPDFLLFSGFSGLALAVPHDLLKRGFPVIDNPLEETERRDVVNQAARQREPSGDVQGLILGKEREFGPPDSRPDIDIRYGEDGPEEEPAEHRGIETRQVVRGGEENPGEGIQFLEDDVDAQVLLLVAGPGGIDPAPEQAVRLVYEHQRLIRHDG